MSVPVLTPATNKSGYLPSEAVNASWTVVDADNDSETLVFEGTDSEGNAVSAVLVLNRNDPFTMTRVYWQRTGTNLVINNTARTATGVMPGA